MVEKALKPPYIYALVDLRTPKHIRYVGMAFRNPQRPFDHAKLAQRGYKATPKLMKWIRGLQGKKSDYGILILHRLPQGSCRELVETLEQKYISLFRAAGHRLTNASYSAQQYAIKHSSRKKGA